MSGRISVVVPSYRRPESLRRCLTALAEQTRLPDEVVIGVRAGDDATLAEIARSHRSPFPVRVAFSGTAGVVAAMQSAVDAATGDIIALTDDDARPRVDWVAGLRGHLDAAPDVGGVGGRDWQPAAPGTAAPGTAAPGTAARVGVAQWYGRLIGNHHLGAGPARDVDLLKGVNCAYRAPLLRAVGFDARLRGDGAQLHWELGVCLPLRRAGWRLVYDPAVAVDHDVAPRHGVDQLHRGVFSTAPLLDAVHNETLELWEGRGIAFRTVFLVWALLIGTGDAPGLLQAFRHALRGDRTVLMRWRATLAGRRAGIATARRNPRSEGVPRPPVR